MAGPLRLRCCACLGQMAADRGSQTDLLLPPPHCSTLGSILLEGQALSGPLPNEWGAPGSLPALYDLKLAGNSLTGSLPEAWGGAQAFPSLFRM